MRNYCAVMVLFASLAAPQAAIPNDMNATIQSLNASKKEATRLRAELEETERELEHLRELSTANARSAQRAERAASSAEKRLATTNKSLEKAQATYAKKRDAYMRALRQLLALRRLPPTAFFGEKDKVATMVKTAGALQLAERALSSRAVEMKNNVDRLASLKAQLVEDRAQNDARKQSLNEAQKKLRRDLAERQKLQKSLTKDHAKAQADVARLAKASRNLGELIDKLDAKPTATSSLAAARKGSWRVPVAGSLLMRYGDKKSGNERYRGVLLSARSGGTVVAPSAGKVVFMGPFRDYGEMVLLRHDKNHISLLAGLGRIDVAMHQQIATGEPIGRMGNEGSAKLYIELRKSGKTIDPSAWYAKFDE